MVTVIANNSDNVIDLTLDLPFYTQTGKSVTTTKTASNKSQTLTQTT